MEDNIISLSRNNETQKRKDLLNLLQEWEETVKLAKREKRFLYDGFFPGYFNTSPKVLFIAREAREQLENDYIQNTIYHFDNPKGDESRFWERILCMFNIIMNNGVIEDKTSFEIWQSMKRNNIGFASINISKYINDSENSQTSDKNLIKKFLSDSKLGTTDYIRKQIEILDPDILITGNVA